jgi:hypothetical protein
MTLLAAKQVIEHAEDAAYIAAAEAARAKIAAGAHTVRGSGQGRAWPVSY